MSRLQEPAVAEPEDFGTYLRFLRRRVRITQRELGLRVGYSEGHVCRLEQNQRIPEPSVIAALFVPALGLSHDPATAGRLLERAGRVRYRGPSLSPSPNPNLSRIPVAVADDGPRLPPAPSHLVNRSDALAGLADLLDTEPIVVVRGLAGTGKTTLAAQYARARTEHEHEHEDVLWITAAPGVVESPEALVLGIAHRVAGRGRPGLALLVEPADGQPQPLGRQVGLLVAALAQRPTLLCMDNADALTGPGVLAALAELVQSAAGARLLLTSRRSLELPGAVHYRLGGLERDLSLDLVGRLDPDMSPASAARLAELTQGNPMLLRLALGQTRQPGADRQALIDGLTTNAEIGDYLLRTMLDGLSPTAARLADLLSVFRQPVDLYDEALVEQLRDEKDMSDPPGLPDLPEAISELHRRQLIDQPAAAALHPLVQGYTYTHLVGDLDRRRALHHIAAVWSEQRGDADLEAAWHFRQAGEDEQAAELLCGHMHALIGRGQSLAAADLAVELRDRLRHRAEVDALLVQQVNALIGELLRDTTRWAEAESAFREVLAGDLPPAVWAQTAGRLAMFVLRRGQVGDGLELCLAALSRLGDEDTLLRAELTVTHAQARAVRGEFDEAGRLGREALALAGEASLIASDPADAIAALAGSLVGVTYALQRRFDEAVPELRVAIDRAQRTSQPRLAANLQFNLASFYVDQGDLTEASPLLLAVAERARQTGDDYLLARVEHLRGQIAFFRGEQTQAIDFYDRACELKQRVGDAPGLANSEMSRSAALRSVGRVEEALAIQRSVLTRSMTVFEPRARAAHLDEHGVTLLVAGEPAAALDRIRAALETADAANDPVYRTHLALAQLVSGSPDQAVALSADELPGPDSPLETQADARLLRAALALTRHDAPAVAAIADELATWVAASGCTMHRDTPAALLAAAADPPPPIHIPELLWVTGKPGPDTADAADTAVVPDTTATGSAAEG